MNELESIPRCPECRTTRNPEAASCSRCGLIFVTEAHAARRKSDQKRRSIDLMQTSCKVCRGSIDRTAMRCRHCGEILDPRYRAHRARRLRSKINYASWIAYILGFLMLFILQPVGVIAIIGGLLLSIAYYAIRVEDPEEEPEEETTPPAGTESQTSSAAEPVSSTSRWSRLKRQFGVEKIRLGSKGKIGVVVAGTPLLLVLIGWATNYSMLQIPINQVLSSGTAVFDISGRYEYYVVPGVIVLEIDEIRNREEAERTLEQIVSDLSDRRVEEIDFRSGDHSVRIDSAKLRSMQRDDYRDLVRQLTGTSEAAVPQTPSSSVRIPIEAN
jgi:hypothetical protein